MTSIGYVASAFPVASRPAVMDLSSPDGNRRVVVTAGAVSRFEPLRTNHLVITFPRELPTENLERRTGRSDEAPIGVAELMLPALKDLSYSPDPSAATGAACGLGPRLIVDGREIPTAVVGTVADVLRSASLSWVTCGSPGLLLDAGPHRIQALSSTAFVPQSLSFRPATDDRPVINRPVRVGSWGSVDRDFTVGAGGRSLIVVPENFNKGWSAHIGGRLLQPARVDGWQQAWLLPAGVGGQVTLTYMPDRLYRQALFVGSLVALSPFVLLLLGRRRRLAGPQVRRAGFPGARGTALIACGALVVVGGLLCVPGLAVAAALLRARLAWLSGVALVATSLATLVAVWSELTGKGTSGGDGVLAQVSVLIAVAVLVAASTRRPRGGPDSDAERDGPGQSATGPESRIGRAK